MAIVGNKERAQQWLCTKKISNSDSAKYFGVWFDDKLNQKLSLQLARCSNMLYHIIRDFVNDQTTLVIRSALVEEPGGARLP